jgi:hypothetical protein
MDTVQLTSRLTAANADARPLVAAHRRPHDEDERRVAPRSTVGQPGGVRRAVVDALASAGLAPGANAATTGDVPAVDRVQLREDMHDFMHALHEAVKGARREARTSTEDGSTAEATDAGSETPRRPFAEGLGALISDVSTGQAPEGLQSAFDKVLGDLPGTGDKTPSLLGFLNKLQALLGYGAPAADTPTVTGSLVDLRA